MSVAENFRPSVRGEKIQPARELLFDFRLKTMVVAVAVCSCKAGTLPEIRERDSSLGNGDFRGVCGRGQDSGDVVGAGKDLQMAGERGYVPGLHRHRRGQLVLESQIAAHRIGSDVVELDAS